MLYEFLTQMARLPLTFFKRAMANPMGIFIYGIISKWYIMVMISVLCVTYWVFKGLEQSGVLAKMEDEVRGGLYQAQSVAQNCTPKIANLSEMWDCIQNLPPYVPNEDERLLRRTLEKDRQDIAGSMSGEHAAHAGSDGNTQLDPYDEQDSSNNSSTSTSTTSGIAPVDSSSDTSLDDSSGSSNSTMQTTQ